MRNESDANRVISLYADAVRRICFIYLKNYSDVEDIFQEVFLKYMLHKKIFENDEHEKAWLIRVSINACKDKLKSFFYKNIFYIEDLNSEPFYLEDNDKELLKAVLKLPQKYKDVIYLFYYEGYTAVEIAKILCKNENTIYTWLSRAKIQLKDYLGGEEVTNKIHNVFDKIQAENALKEKTEKFLIEEITKRMQKQKTHKLNRFYAVCASLVLFIFVIGFSYNIYFTPTAYIDIDINPSIELTINRFGRVLAAKPYNDDGEIILKNAIINYEGYDKAVKKLVETLDSKEFFKQDSLLSVTVQSNNSANESKILEDVQTIVSSYLQTHHSNVATNIFSISEDVRVHAHENNVSPAKYMAIKELQKVDPTAQFDDCKEHSIGKLKQLTKMHGKHEESGHH